MEEGYQQLESDQDSSEYEDCDEDVSDNDSKKAQEKQEDDCSAFPQIEYNPESSRLIVRISQIELKEPIPEQAIDAVKNLTIIIVHDQSQNTMYARQLSRLKAVESLTIERSEKYISCTKWLEVLVNILEEMEKNLSNLKVVNLRLRNKEKPIIFDNNMVWDDPNEKIKIKKVDTISFMYSKNQDNNLEQIIRRIDTVRRNKYGGFLVILKVLLGVVERSGGLHKLQLDMPSWFCNHQNLGSNYQNYFYEIFEVIGKLVHASNSRLRVFKLNAFQWGYYNTEINVTHFEQILIALSRLPSQQLHCIELDFGRWGCEEYSSNKIFTNHQLNHITNVLENQLNLQKFSLKLRSWAYDNSRITDVGLISLLKALQNLKEIKSLELELQKWDYSNSGVSKNSIDQLGNTLKTLNQLHHVNINMSPWECQSIQEVESVLRIHRAPLNFSKLKSVPKIKLDDDLQRVLNVQASVEKYLELKMKNFKKRLLKMRGMMSTFSSLLRKEIINASISLDSQIDSKEIEALNHIIWRPLNKRHLQISRIIPWS